MLFFTSVKLTLLALAAMPVVLLPIELLGLRVRKLLGARSRTGWPTSRATSTRRCTDTVLLRRSRTRTATAAVSGARVEAVFAVAAERSA